MKRDFAKLWAGQTISEVGSRITREGLPMTALLTLNATAGQMGILSAVGGGASVLIFGLGAGAAVDRLKKRPVMIAADLGRAGLLGFIPLAACKHALSITGLDQHCSGCGGFDCSVPARWILLPVRAAAWGRLCLDDLRSE